MDFGEALRIIKNGGKCTRKGWNGKDQYIQLAKGIAYKLPDDSGRYETCYHEDIGSQAILFVGTRGKQMGWLASQSDMLAKDWEEVR